jgi:hypothetical protein
MPPENAGYAYAAYAAAITVYTVYAVSIWWRGHALAARIRGADDDGRPGASSGGG